ncbi:Glutaredoxin 3 [Chytridiales sp. JEL 0842]|nr:Glutaredoxin 3 [Chytridiales sp. JEL 0842]
MTKVNTISITTDEQYAKLTSPSSSNLVSIVNFFASWAPQCNDMNEIEAEEFPDISEEAEIAAVPTFVVVKEGKVVDRVEGANAPALTSLVEKLTKSQSTFKPSTTTTTASSTPAPAPATLTPEQLNARLKALINSNRIMLFIKGTPDQPRCGFSKQLIEVLADLRVKYGSFNILADEAVRAGLKEYSNWPTFPQVYIDGELIGGLDIVKEMVASGEFQKLAPPEDELTVRLQKLIKKAPIMLFMKGNPDQPRCGFSRQLVGLLRDKAVKFDTFDILEDEEVRAALKEFSNWPTYPQLYINGELMGGLDIVKEMMESGDFDSMVPAEARSA